MPSTLEDLLDFIKLSAPGGPLEKLHQLDQRTHCMVLAWALRERGHADPDARVADIKLMRTQSGVFSHGQPRIHAVGVRQKNRRVLVDIHGNVGKHAIASALAQERWGVAPDDAQYEAHVVYSAKDASSDKVGCVNYLNGVREMEKKRNQDTLASLMREIPRAIEHAALDADTQSAAPRKLPKSRL